MNTQPTRPTVETDSPKLPSAPHAPAAAGLNTMRPATAAIVTNTSHPAGANHAAGGAEKALLNAFTVDVEDYFHVSGFEQQISRDSWHEFESRVELSTHRILNLLDDHQVQGTFFVLGWVAERFPQLVREIHDRGHEIGSHSYWHQLVYNLTPEQFREDLQRSRHALEDAAGQQVTVYRAPSFSITRRSLWALEILIEEGFTTDSSIFPIHHDRYGIPDAQPRLHRVATKSGPIWEFPPSVVRRVGVNLPVSGGGYFRLYPQLVTHSCLRGINQRVGEPFMFYIHPWEVDPQQPRLTAGSRLGRWRHYVNLHRTEPKLRSLLRNFNFGSMKSVIQRQVAHRAAMAAPAVSAAPRLA